MLFDMCKWSEFCIKDETQYMRFPVNVGFRECVNLCTLISLSTECNMQDKNVDMVIELYYILMSVLRLLRLVLQRR